MLVAPALPQPNAAPTGIDIDSTPERMQPMRAEWLPRGTRASRTAGQCAENSTGSSISTVCKGCRVGDYTAGDPRRRLRPIIIPPRRVSLPTRSFALSRGNLRRECTRARLRLLIRQYGIFVFD